MAYNRKMRKFEGTCYIPGEQLAMMAKYYRGANLNLNLTLFEDDLAMMQENLEQACWCSKLNEVDRMKMAHMKGNEWRIAHDHCLEEGRQPPDDKNPMVCQVLPRSSRSAVGKVDRGTSAHSLYDRERGLVRGGRYQRDEGYDPRCCGYNYSRGRRGLRWDPYSVRENYDDGGYPANSSGQQNPDRRCDLESEFAMSSLQDGPREIRCAVCNVETCLVCKNHLFSPICQCKCPVANAALCNRCNQEPCEEEEEKKAPQETKANNMDLPTMMMSMMMGSMLNPPQSPVCCCRTTRDNSESSCSDSSDEKVHKVYLYDCDCSKKDKKPKRKSRKSSSDSSTCDCCRCSHKSKKNSKTTKGFNSNGSDAAQKNASKTRKGTTENDDTVNKSSDEDKKKSFSSKKGKDTTQRSAERSNGDNRSVSFTKLSSSTNQRLTSQSDDTKELRRPTKSPHNIPPRLGVAELIAQHNLSDLESSKTIKKNEEPIEEEESSTTFNLREFIVSLPKIQSNLQNLMSKLNQIQTNQPFLQQMDPSLANAQRQIYEMRRLYGYPLIASHQNPLHNPPCSLYKEQTEHPDPVEDNACQASYFSVPNAPPTIFPGSSGDEAKFQKPSNAPNYQSAVNCSTLGEAIESVKSPHHGRARVVENRISEQGLLQKITIPVQSPSLTFAGKKTLSQISGSRSALKKDSGRIHHYPNVDKIDKSDVFPSNCSIGSSLQIVELPGTKHYSKNENLNQKSTNASMTFTPPRNDIFHSYKRSPETTIQDLTEYASFTEGKHNNPLPAISVQHIPFQKSDIDGAGETKIAQHNNRSPDINLGCRSHNLLEDTLPRITQVLKAHKTVSFNAQEQNIVREYSLQRSQELCGSKTYEVRKDQGVGPGIFCRSKSDTSLDPLTKRKHNNNKPDASDRLMPLTANNHKPMKNPPRIDKFNIKTAPSKFKSDQTESLLEVTSAYVKQDTSNQMYAINSFVQAVNENKSTADTLAMVRGMASSSLMNTTNACQLLPNSFEELDIIPMLPVSSSVPGEEPEPSSENPSGPIEHKQDSSDNEVNVTTPGFLRKSQAQAEQLKRAHETIRSMIKNVNDVIAQIDSDSKIGIKSKVRREDNQQQSYYIHLDDEPQKSNDSKYIEPMRSGIEKPCSSEQNQDIQAMFQRVKRVINSPTPSEHSNVTGESHPRTEDTQPSRARRDYFVLNSESTTTAFTESLRRSLENEASGSLPLTTSPAERNIPQRPKNTRPLKRRSWCPPPKQ